MKEILEFYKNSGVDEIISDLTRDKNKQMQQNTEPSKQKESNKNSIIEKIHSELKNINSLEELRNYTQSFDRCPLKKLAKTTVFSDGTNKSKVMFVGEAPGATEDEKGIPFCGQSGKLLTNIINSMGFPREEAYITNTVFWRPPGNRRPTPEEIAICRPIVEKHISLAKPKLIILVGSTAVESLLSDSGTMHDLRQKNFEYKNRYLEDSISTAVIFHPSYLLRQQQKKKLMWEDVIKLKKMLK